MENLLDAGHNRGREGDRVTGLVGGHLYSIWFYEVASEGDQLKLFLNMIYSSMFLVRRLSIISIIQRIRSSLSYKYIIKRCHN